MSEPARRTMPAPREDGFEPVARLDELPDGTLLGVTRADGERVCLVNEGGVISAVSDTCTHAEFPLHEGEARGCVLECIWHGARYDLRTGAVLRGPAEEPLPVYDTRVEDGWILIGPRRNDS